MGRRTWVKIYCDKWIEGTIRQESAALRGVWTDLLALCGSSEYSDLGEIKVRNGIGFTDLQFQKTLNLSRKEWLTIKNRLIETQRIHQNADNILTIINWKIYQSEYERQKPQRTKSAGESAGESAAIDQRVENIDQRVENISSKKTILPDFINKETWDAFLEMRKVKKAIPTAHAKALLIKELEKLKLAGDDPDEVLNQSIMNSWKGVFSLKGGHHGTGYKPPKPEGASKTGRTIDAEREDMAAD